MINPIIYDGALSKRGIGFSHEESRLHLNEKNNPSSSTPIIKKIFHRTGLMINPIIYDGALSKTGIGFSHVESHITGMKKTTLLLQHQSSKNNSTFSSIPTNYQLNPATFLLWIYYGCMLLYVCLIK